MGRDISHVLVDISDSDLYLFELKCDALIIPSKIVACLGHERPSVKEYPQVAELIKEALDDVFYNGVDPEKALNEAASESARLLGW
jgi:hypothetical protein